MADRQSINRVPSATAASPTSRLRGHVGHLTREESAALDGFKQLTAKAGLFTPATAKRKASHDDGTLVYACRVSEPEIKLPNEILVGICAPGSSSYRTLSNNSRTRKIGGETTIWRRSTK